MPYHQGYHQYILPSLQCTLDYPDMAPFQCPLLCTHMDLDISLSGFGFHHRKKNSLGLSPHADQSLPIETNLQIHLTEITFYCLISCKVLITYWCTLDFDYLYMPPFHCPLQCIQMDLDISLSGFGFLLHTMWPNSLPR